MRFVKSRKGFSTLVTALIMCTLIVAVSCVVVYSWAKNYIDTKLAETERRTQLGQIVISSITLKPGTNNTIVVVVHNIGKKTVTLDKVYIDGIEGNISGAGEIAPENTKTVTAVVDGSFNSGRTYTVKVVCTDGCSDTKSFSP